MMRRTFTSSRFAARLRRSRSQRIALGAGATAERRAAVSGLRHRARADRCDRRRRLDETLRRHDARRLGRKSGCLESRERRDHGREHGQSAGSARRTSSGAEANPADFELKLEIKAESDIHGGVFYRGQGSGAGARTRWHGQATDLRRTGGSEMERHRLLAGLRLRPRQRRQRAGHWRTDRNADRLARPHRAHGTGQAAAVDRLTGRSRRAHEGDQAR